MKPDDVAKVAGYELKLDGMTQRQGPNYREMVAQFTVSLDGGQLSTMTPSKRNFTTRGSTTTEAALLTRGASQLYISLGDTAADGAIAVRIYHKPMVLLIWFGPVLMAFGGMLSLSDRRLRVGAPKPAQVPCAACRRRSDLLKQILACSVCFRCVMVASSAAYAVQPDEIMPDPAKESRARDLSRELRCMVCQNQSIDDSEAPLARDLRLLVRERIAAGDSDAQVLDFLVARYGEFVLLKPRLEAHTLLLWLLPPLALVGGGLALVDV